MKYGIGFMDGWMQVNCSGNEALDFYSPTDLGIAINKIHEYP